MENTNTHPTEVEPGPDRPDWIDFLRWMATDNITRAPYGQAHNPYEAADAMVDIVEKPQNYSDEYLEYLNQGGLNR